MKPYKVKHTMTQEYIVFAESREEAIENCDYNPDFDNVFINNESYAQGDVIDGNMTATSLGNNALVIFTDSDYKKAIELWQDKKFEGSVYIKTNQDIKTVYDYFYNELTQEERIELSVL